MVALTLLAPVLLGCLAAAKTCTNVTVPVTIMARQGTNFTNASLTGYQTVNLPANISAKYCKPDNDSSSSPTVQVLSHGIGFDKSYWDLPYNDYNYSYIDVALAHGFHTVSIDRFGIGNSSHGDPLNVVQAPAEVSALYDITMMLRSGDFPSVSTAFNKVVHVGHSFGSAQTYLLSAMHPNATDGIALTGFSMNATWLPQTLADWNLHLARLNQPLRFGNQTVSRSNRWTALFFNTAPVQLLQSVLQSIGIQLSPYQVWEEIASTELGDLINQWNATVAPVAQNLPTGYLTWSDFTSNIFAFLHPGMFDIGLGIFSEMTKQPVTLGEIFTLANGAPMINPFTGPVQVVTGQRDAIYCGGDCLNTGGVAASIPAMVKSNFPDASVFETVIQPNTGHGINLHYNSTGAYEAIQTFFTSNNLGGY